MIKNHIFLAMLLVVRSAIGECSIQVPPNVTDCNPLNMWLGYPHLFIENAENCTNPDMKSPCLVTFSLKAYPQASNGPLFTPICLAHTPSQKRDGNILSLLPGSNVTFRLEEDQALIGTDEVHEQKILNFGIPSRSQGDGYVDRSLLPQGDLCRTLKLFDYSSLQGPCRENVIDMANRARKLTMEDLQKIIPDSAIHGDIYAAKSAFMKILANPIGRTELLYLLEHPLLTGINKTAQIIIFFGESGHNNFTRYYRENLPKQRMGYYSEFPAMFEIWNSTGSELRSDLQYENQCVTMYNEFKQVSLFLIQITGSVYMQIYDRERNLFFGIIKLASVEKLEAHECLFHELRHTNDYLDDSSNSLWIHIAGQALSKVSSKKIKDDPRLEREKKRLRARYTHALYRERESMELIQKKLNISPIPLVDYGVSILKFLLTDTEEIGVILGVHTILINNKLRFIISPVSEAGFALYEGNRPRLFHKTGVADKSLISLIIIHQNFHCIHPIYMNIYEQIYGQIQNFSSRAGLPIPKQL
ncbi:MAG: hypothetical protein LBJ89_01020 [Holosporales bacterium]|jgi:hypothetical protein|nr:hypothetical protein [Holosporales bacterium]